MKALPSALGGMVKPGGMALGRGAPPAVPGTAMRRGIGTASQGAGARPMTAVSGAGFNSRQSIGPGNDSMAAVTLEPKIETFALLYTHLNCFEF